MAAADGVATFVVNLDGNLQAGAQASARSLDDLRAEVLAGEGALRQMNAAMRSLKGGASTNIEAFKTLKAQITAQKAKIAGLNTEYVKLGGTFERIKSPGATNGLRELGSAATGIPGPLGEIATKGSELSGVLGAGGVAGAALLAVAALAAITVATLAAVGKLARFAVVSADAARSQLLLWQAALKGGKGAEGLGASVDRVRRSVALSRTELAGMATGLAKAGLRGAELESALEAIGIAQAVGLDTGPIQAQIEKAAKLGKSVESITSKIRAQYGGIAAKQMLGLGAQATKLKDDIGAIFEGIDAEPFLASLKDMLKFFDQSTSTGKALKQLMTSLLSPLVSGAAAAMPSMKEFFRGMLIGALKATVWVLTLRNGLRKLTAGIDLGEHSKALKALGITAAVAAISIGLVAAGVTAIVTGLAIMTGLAVAAGGLLIAAFVAAAFAPLLLGIAIKNAVVAGVAKLAELGKAAFTAGTNFVNGLVNGITGGVTRVAAAAKGLAAAAIKATDIKLDAHSPSRVMIKRGDWTAEGFALGMEGGAPDVKRAAESLVSIPAQAASGDLGAAAKGAPGGGGGPTTVNYNVQITGVENAEQLTDPSMASKLAATLERVITIAGLNPEPA